MSIKNYNQWRAMLAVARASFITFLKSPSALIFSIGFPIIFIVLFGVLKGKSMMRIPIYIQNFSQDSNLYYGLQQLPMLAVAGDIVNLEEANTQLKKNTINAIITIKDNSSTTSKSKQYKLHTTTNSISKANGQSDILNVVLQEYNRRLNSVNYPDNKNTIVLSKPTIIKARTSKQIDFILPGQLGFSLISTGIFGVAFSFFFLRKTGVLKRMFATPIKRHYILLGEGLARIIFQMLTAVIIIGFGYLLFDFTLLHGWWTAIQLLLLCFLGLIVFMNIGFLISNLCDQEQAIPGVANLVTIPQFLLSGSFFAISIFPNWLQKIAQLLPLTHLNNALRQVSYEGKNLWQVKLEVGILLGFGLVFYWLNTKTFKWS